jgi:hypothetical protein
MWRRTVLLHLRSRAVDLEFGRTAPLWPIAVPLARSAIELQRMLKLPVLVYLHLRNNAQALLLGSTKFLDVSELDAMHVVPAIAACETLAKECYFGYFMVIV